MHEPRATTGRFSDDPRHRDSLIRQVIRARRSVDAGLRSQGTAAGDPAKAAPVDRARQWTQGDPPHDARPGGAP